LCGTIDIFLWLVVDTVAAYLDSRDNSNAPVGESGPGTMTSAASTYEVLSADAL